MKRPVVFFDLETAGLERKHPIIQIAAIAVHDWNELESMECKLKFDDRQADPKALEINCYEPAVWMEEAVPRSVGLERFVSFIDPYRSMPAKSARGRTWKNTMLAGHNIVRFDMDRIMWLAKDLSVFLAVDFRGLDTLQLALWTILERGDTPPENFKLTTLCQHFGISTEGAHDALADVRMSIQLAQKCVELQQAQ